MARPKASEQRDTRQVILDASLELFSEGGFHGTSLRDIALAVGVRESAIYHHFPSKEAIFEALLEGIQEGPQQAKTALAAPIPPDADLQVMLERLATTMLEHMGTLRARKLFRLMMQDGLRLAAQGRFDLWGRMGAAREPMMKLLEALVAKGRLRKAPPELLALEFISPLMMWRQLQIVAPQHPYVTDYRTFCRLHVEQFLNGAAPRPPKLSNRSSRSAS